MGHDPKKCKCQDDTKGQGSIVNNLQCLSKDNPVDAPPRPCLPIELIKNGGFEVTGIFGEYADWNTSSDNIEFARFTPAYEGRECALFQTVETSEPEIKTAVLSQSVTVPPGCYLIFSFAEAFEDRGVEDANPFQIRARVYYDSTNLINIDLRYTRFPTGGTFNFHQRVSDHPVPFNVTSVTIEFFVEMNDKKGTGWLLDGVSLRAV